MKGARWLVVCLLLGASASAAEEEARPPTRFERAVAVLGAPAVSADDSRRAKAELAAIIAGEEDSADASAARYLLGRLKQLENNEADPPEFQALRARHPGHPLAQLAALTGLLTEVQIPLAEQRGGHARVARTPADRPIVAAIAVSGTDGERVALCGVAARPILADVPLAPPDNFKGSAAYRRAMVNVVTQRALSQVKG